MVEALAPIDTNVTIPPAVKKAGETAEAIHKAAYPGPEPQPPSEQVGADQQPVGHSEDQREQQPPGQSESQPEQQSAGEGTSAVDLQRKPPVPDSGEHGSWEHRYLAMKGRFDQSQTTLGQMQEEMSQLGDELQRTQHALQLARRGQQPQRPQRQSGPPPTITPQDVETYGPELVDFVTRAARGAVEPDLNQVTQQLRQTSQRVQQTARQRMEGELDGSMPEWRQLNTNPRFKQWASLPDIYSRQLRRDLINDAAKAADAPRVAAFFKAFLAEEQATGQMPTLQPPPVETPPPRQAAVELSTLASPGRAKPAAGNGYANAADKPVFTRAQISRFYSNEGRAAYAGREADRQRDEQEIYAAQREGRVR